jgi:hypothetical protein
MTPPSSTPQNYDKVLQSIQQQLKNLTTKIDNVEKFQQQQTELTTALQQFGEKLAAIEKRLDNNNNGNNGGAEEQERRRSIVLIGLEEKQEEKASKRVENDRMVVTDILDELNVDSQFACYRLGKPKENGHGRLIKVVFPASVFVGITLAGWKRNRESMRETEGWRRLLIRPSLDKQALQEDWQKREAKRKERSSNINTNDRYMK